MNPHRVEYNNKENITGTKLLNYGARHYDPIIGKWLGVDPMVEKYYGLSGYNYVLNNPTGFIDPDGRASDDVIITGEQAVKTVAALNTSSSLTIT